MSDPVSTFNPVSLVIPLVMLFALALVYGLSYKRPGFTLKKFGIAGIVAVAATSFLLPCFAMALFMLGMVGQVRIPNTIAGVAGAGLAVFAGIGVLLGMAVFVLIYLATYAMLGRFISE